MGHCRKVVGRAAFVLNFAICIPATASVSQQLSHTGFTLGPSVQRKNDDGAKIDDGSDVVSVHFSSQHLDRLSTFTLRRS
jgi:hypothetical protein